jgi:hypothetical protein
MQATQIVPFDESFQQFKKYVTAWLELDELVKKLQKALSEKRKLKQRVQEKITEYMGQNSVEDVKIHGVRLRHNVRNAPVPLKKDEIRQRALDRYGKDKGEEILGALFERKDVVTKSSLRRIKVGPAVSRTNTTASG